jgi:hypothetical protein
VWLPQYLLPDRAEHVHGDPSFFTALHVVELVLLLVLDVALLVLQRRWWQEQDCVGVITHVLMPDFHSTHHTSQWEQGSMLACTHTTSHRPTVTLLAVAACWSAWMPQYLAPGWAW